MDAQPSYSPSTVEDVFKDFKARRTAMLKALTTDVERFYGECDPEKENLCLYGFPDGNWDVSFPAEEVPPELPEPALGINFARDGMARKDWLSLVAVHSDAWLYAVAFYYGARFDKGDRKRLFDMMNDLPTVFDVVTGRRIVKEKPPNNSNSKVRKTINDVQQQQKNPENNYGRSAKRARPKEDEEEDEEDDDEEEEEEDEQGDTFCGSCAGAYSKDEFWIACDICEKWYHGLCVKVSASRAANIKQYKCPSCSNKRGRA